MLEALLIRITKIYCLIISRLSQEGVKYCKYNRVYEKKNLHLQSQQNGIIAQLVEQRTENPCVAGSIPADTTK